MRRREARNAEKPRYRGKFRRERNESVAVKRENRVTAEGSAQAKACKAEKPRYRGNLRRERSESVAVKRENRVTADGLRRRRRVKRKSRVTEAISAASGAKALL
ncbi:hypothetical protein DVH26_14130 [Paenibacillus sp. H1-7]|nr:hypothetical protein DVH26_14130 [Paenibacillus sp. H1-7]